MDQLLTELFHLQRFAENPALREVIDEVERRYEADALDDNALEALSAAGDPYARTPGRREEDALR